MRKSPCAMAFGSAAVALGLVVAGAATTADHTPVPQDVSVSAGSPGAAHAAPRHTPGPAAPTAEGTAAASGTEPVARSAAERLRARLGEAFAPGVPDAAHDELGVTFGPGAGVGAGGRNAAVGGDPAPHAFGPNPRTG
ncbi:hypothetical protein GCM10023224_29240 [Streptomonospora halophila]|uniref:Uncharacterized protein n=1 Tax=Streptomonospora halophila TaxID=427369 RepID=A0ABP9GIA4_9ACTN